MTDMTQPPIEPTPYGAPEHLQNAPEPVGRHRGKLPIIAAAAAVVLVAGGTAGGVLAYQALSGGGPQPDRYAPASSFAYLKVDLDPAASQKLAARDFADTFQATKGKDFGDIRDQVLSSMFDDSDLDYTRDVKPWIGDRAAVAGFLDTAGIPRLEIIAAYRDQAEARARLTKVKDAFFSVQDGYVVLAGTQRTVDEAVKAAATHNIGDDATYRNDVDRLPDARIVTGWADGDRIDGALRKQLATGSDRELQQFLALTRAQGHAGRIAVAGRFAGGYAEVEGRVTGAAPTMLRTGAGDGLARLPDDTMAALSVNGLGPTLKKQFKQQLALPGFNPKDLRQFEAQTGVHLPDDLATLLGDRTVLALGDLPRGDGMPLVGLQGTSKDAANAERVARRLGRYITASPVPVDVQRSGDTVTMAVGRGFADRLAAGGSLGQQPGFRAAMGELGDQVTVAGYADLDRLLVDEPAGSPARALRGFGMSISQDGADMVLRMRLTVS